MSPLWRLLITALHRAILQDELGLEPSEALTRLQRAVLVEGSTEERRHPRRPAAVPRPPRQLPHDITRFTGRTDELARLDELLPDDGGAGAPTIISISGPPGVGKPHPGN